MTKPKLTLLVDIVSPFAYIAFYVTKNSAIFKQCDVTYVPILLGGVMKATNNKTPIEIKNKDKWIMKERVRYNKSFSIPALPDTPKPFPQSTVTAQRALCAIELHHPDKLAESISALYHIFFAEGKPISKAETVAEALKSVFGEAGAKEVMGKVGEAEVKQQLQANTNKALELGAFGLPWFVATNAQGETETFWGVDHMGQVVEHLGLERNGEPGLRALL